MRKPDVEGDNVRFRAADCTEADDGSGKVALPNPSLRTTEIKAGGGAVEVMRIYETDEAEGFGEVGKDIEVETETGTIDDQVVAGYRVGEDASTSLSVSERAEADGVKTSLVWIIVPTFVFPVIRVHPNQAELIGSSHIIP